MTMTEGKSGWLGSKDSNLDSIIQSQVSHEIWASLIH